MKSLPLIHEMKWNALSNNEKKKKVYVYPKVWTAINDRQSINLRSHGTGKERGREREKYFCKWRVTFEDTEWSFSDSAEG